MPAADPEAARPHRLSDANGLVVLAHERADVEAGEVVEAMPFYGLV